MKTMRIVGEALEALKDGDLLFCKGNYEGSVDRYNKGLKLVVSIPAEAVFDHEGYVASCQAGLSAAYGQLGKHVESFAAANKALLFFDACGEKNPAQMSRWLKAIVNQGVALASLGVLEEALRSFQRAKEIFVNRNLDTSKNKEWLEMVDKNIASVKAHLE
jgi:tetratricopeptide (TPR) repeat protein